MFEYSQKERIYIWLNSIFGYNCKRLYRFLDCYESEEELYDAAKSRSLQEDRWLSEEQRNLLYSTSAPDEIDRLIEQYNKKEIRAVTRVSKCYPELLKEIYDPPSVLFLKGRITSAPELPIAVIGARKCTDYGKSAAKQLVKDLVHNGACIISGMALGIDCIASLEAIEHSPKEIASIAVLGSGVDVIYPASNARLYNLLLERGGIVSEFPPGAKAFQAAFPIRNRVISGLSKGVVVIEAAEKSGTLITANYALDYGRDVFCVPGRINDECSAGTNRLIREGSAKLITDANDILVEYMQNYIITESSSKIDTVALTADEKLVVDLLKSGEKNFDELFEMLDMDMGRINFTLTSLEFSGIIKQLPGRLYSLQAK